MGDQQQRGRGRARGRARGGETGQVGGSARGGRGGPAHQPHSQPTPREGFPGGPPPQQPQQPSFWGPRAQMAQARGPSPQSMAVSGRAIQRGVASAGGAAAAAAGGGGGDGGMSAEAHLIGRVAGAGYGEGTGQLTARRGNVRSNRQLHEGVGRTRPDSLATKQGSHGTTVRLSANYFKLIQKGGWCLYQYRVDFAPEDRETHVKKKLFRTAIQNVLPAYIFDGTVLYASNRLNPEPYEVFVEDTLRNENVRITIRMVGDVTAGDYHSLQFFNIIMRKCLGHLKLQLVGRNFFDVVAKINIPDHRLELWPGYVTSIRQHEQSILLCVEISHKVMRHETAFTMLCDSLKEDRSNYRSIYQKNVIGKIVLTDYNNKTYRIDDIDFSVSPSSTFNRKDGSAISYIDYYKNRYNLRITNPDQPMLVSRAKAREIRAGMAEIVYLVPELCRMTGLTDAQRNNFNLMRSLAEYTRVNPSGRIEKLMGFSQRLTNQPEIVQELRQWDLQLANNLVDFPGRVLPPETITGGQGGTYSAGRDVDWTKELRSRPMLFMAKLNIWVVICSSRSKNDAQSFVQVLIKAAKGMHWNIPFPKLQEIRDDNSPTYVKGLEMATSSYNPELLMCVVSNNKADRYSVIKKKCTVEKAVPTQVMLAKNLSSRGVMSIATKVAIQMNCKLGGAPWSVPLPYKTMMVVGYDVCHDPNSRDYCWGALVATLNTECARYYSCVSQHMKKQEIFNDLPLSLVKSCRKWLEVNGTLPDKILIYRDGVGEGQIKYVYEEELAKVKNELVKLYGDEDKVKMTFIVVSKRINTRIFHKGDNPTPGTIVDDVITLPERYDFFIVSQCVRQGTVSPTSYNVLYDSMGQSADKIQRVTYKLTHMYFNWSGTVRVPAPCQYAHKLAFLVAQNLRMNPNPELDTLLYYL